MHVFNPKTVDPDRCETCGISWDQHPSRDPFPGGKTLTNAEMIANLKVTALQAIGEDEWILAATTCRLIAELEITVAVKMGAQAAWDASTRQVPVLKVPMRDDQPCTVCGGNVRMMPMVGDALAKVIGTIPREPKHIDTFGNPIEHDHAPAIGLTIVE